LSPCETCTGAQIVHHRAQRVVPNWSPRSHAGPQATAALFLGAPTLKQVVTHAPRVSMLQAPTGSIPVSRTSITAGHRQSNPQFLVRARYMPNDVGSSARNRDTEEICHDNHSRRQCDHLARPGRRTQPAQVASRTNEADVKPASTRLQAHHGRSTGKAKRQRLIEDDAPSLSGAERSCSSF
jgi:hypothetical protein